MNNVNALAGLLTYSPLSGLPVRWLADSGPLNEHWLLELTAAGQLRNYTVFPFNPLSNWRPRDLTTLKELCQMFSVPTMLREEPKSCANVEKDLGMTRVIFRVMVVNLAKAAFG